MAPGDLLDILAVMLSLVCEASGAPEAEELRRQLAAIPAADPRILRLAELVADTDTLAGMVPAAEPALGHQDQDVGAWLDCLIGYAESWRSSSRDFPPRVSAPRSPGAHGCPPLPG